MGATLHCGVQASCHGLPCCKAQVLGTSAPAVVACGPSSFDSWALKQGLGSCGAQTLLLHDMWDLPRPRIEPMSPASAGGFLSTVPPGKFRALFLSEAQGPLPSLCICWSNSFSCCYRTHGSLLLVSQQERKPLTSWSSFKGLACLRQPHLGQSSF